MKYLILLIFVTGWAWAQTPIKNEGGLISLTIEQVECSSVLSWLANITNSNIAVKQNKQKINVNWHKLPVKQAWSQLNNLCQVDIKPKPMFGISLKWLILDRQAEHILGLDHNSWSINRKDLTPSSDLWQLVGVLRDWELVLKHIFQDLTENAHILTLSEPYIITNQGHVSSIHTNILMPFLVKTSHTTYNTMQSLPMDLTVDCQTLANDKVNLQIKAHMQESWHAGNAWPIAVHAINTNVSLSPGANLIIAKQSFVSMSSGDKQHKWLPILRNSHSANKHYQNLYVMLTIKQLS